MGLILVAAICSTPLQRLRHCEALRAPCFDSASEHGCSQCSLEQSHRPPACRLCSCDGGVLTNVMRPDRRWAFLSECENATDSASAGYWLLVTDCWLLACLLQGPTLDCCLAKGRVVVPASSRAADAPHVSNLVPATESRVGPLACQSTV